MWSAIVEVGGMNRISICVPECVFMCVNQDEKARKAGMGVTTTHGHDENATQI